MRILTTFKVILIMLMPMLIQLATLSVVMAEPPTDRTETARIKPHSNWAPPGEAKIADFNFSVGEVWLKSDGEWKISGWVRHAGILCDRYSVGVQFGIGAPYCINVKWQNNPQFSVPKRQCNNAIVKHLVIDKAVDLVDSFEKITCARRIVRCSGNCKGSSGEFTSKP